MLSSKAVARTQHKPKVNHAKPKNRALHEQHRLTLPRAQWYVKPCSSSAHTWIARNLMQNGVQPIHLDCIAGKPHKVYPISDIKLSELARLALENRDVKYQTFQTDDKHQLVPKAFTPMPEMVS
ncbi:MAG: hypothetical protein A2808_02385 [Candidatus Moranbacteria bacterium RIFCSPHIGHO2_01_FULL_55_24]|nr:MAG: hypothetical protein A2808_02385 [Candidatus Moranbacteria bacterium RIFCSPHIGHO2_01_FULL_55_24]